MKSDEVLLLFGVAFILVPLCLWMYQDNIYAILQVVDSVYLKAFSYLPFVGDYYANVDRAYNNLTPGQLTWQHVWIVGQIAWRPIAMLVFFPMLLRWAWKARKVRRAQSFNDINKAYILKHCATKQTSPACGARQQWVVRRWYHHYGLHRMQWGSAAWNLRLRHALTMQLGRPSGDPQSQALLKEFAVFINEQIRVAFGEKQAAALTVQSMVDEATKNHAYCATAVVRILAAARDQFGVISPQGFRNRLFQSAETVPIWFGLNGLMRQTTHAESLGILSHFYMEVAEGESLKTPQMENAIEGLEKYRTHLINQRKLKDLDESDSYAEQARREEDKKGGEKVSLSKNYDEGEQVIA